MKVLGLFLLLALAMANNNIVSISKVYITQHEPTVIRVAINTAYGEMWYLQSYSEGNLEFNDSDVTGVFTPIVGTEGIQSFTFSCKNCEDGAVYDVILGLKEFSEGESSIQKEYLVEVTDPWDN
jgi:hypothetical protein